MMRFICYATRALRAMFYAAQMVYHTLLFVYMLLSSLSLATFTLIDYAGYDYAITPLFFFFSLFLFTADASHAAYAIADCRASVIQRRVCAYVLLMPLRHYDT